MARNRRIAYLTVIRDDTVLAIIGACSVPATPTQQQRPVWSKRAP